MSANAVTNPDRRCGRRSTSGHGLQGLLLLLALALIACTGPSNNGSGRPEAADRPQDAAGAAGRGASTPEPPVEQPVSFQSGADTIYGSLLLPSRPASSKLPAALILSGSGPVDRNGDGATADTRLNTNINFARALASLGYASFRYDKLGSGQTGLATHTDASQIGFDLYIDEARDGLAYLRSRPEVDPARTFVLGHSEGGLIALVLANRLHGSEAPRGLILAAPPGAPILETLRRQKADQLTAAVQSGQVTRQQADRLLADDDRVIAALKSTGAVLATVADPWLRLALSPANVHAVAEEERYDPAELAKTVPPATPVIVLHGDKDTQISTGDIQALMQGFTAAGNRKAIDRELANVDHVFKEVPSAPNPIIDYTNPALLFSRDAMAAVGDFIKTNH